MFRSCIFSSKLIIRGLLLCFWDVFGDFFRDMLLRPPMLALMLCDFANSWFGTSIFTNIASKIKTKCKIILCYHCKGPLHPCDRGSNFLLGGSWLWHRRGERLHPCPAFTKKLSNFGFRWDGRAACPTLGDFLAPSCLEQYPLRSIWEFLVPFLRGFDLTKFSSDFEKKTSLPNQLPEAECLHWVRFPSSWWETPGDCHISFFQECCGFHTSPTIQISVSQSCRSGANLITSFRLDLISHHKWCFLDWLAYLVSTNVAWISQ